MENGNGKIFLTSVLGRAAGGVATRLVALVHVVSLVGESFAVETNCLLLCLFISEFCECLAQYMFFASRQIPNLEVWSWSV